VEQREMGRERVRVERGNGRKMKRRGERGRHGGCERGEMRKNTSKAIRGILKPLAPPRGRHSVVGIHTVFVSYPFPRSHGMQLTSHSSFNIAPYHMREFWF
jgi:hypothetical protein